MLTETAGCGEAHDDNESKKIMSTFKQLNLRNALLYRFLTGDIIGFTLTNFPVSSWVTGALSTLVCAITIETALTVDFLQ